MCFWKQDPKVIWSSLWHCALASSKATRIHQCPLPAQQPPQTQSLRLIQLSFHLLSTANLLFWSLRSCMKIILHHVQSTILMQIKTHSPRTSKEGLPGGILVMLLKNSQYVLGNSAPQVNDLFSYLASNLKLISNFVPFS